MTESDAIQLAVGIVGNAALAGLVIGFFSWFVAKPEKK